MYPEYQANNFIQKKRSELNNSLRFISDYLLQLVLH